MVVGWIDEAATYAALEMLLEDMFGPLAFWQHSWICLAFSSNKTTINSWPLMFSYGPTSHQEGVNRYKLAALWNGLGFGSQRRHGSNLWLSIKWYNLFAFTDFDYRGGDFLDEDLADISEMEAWLLALLAKYLLYADRAYMNSQYQLERTSPIVPMIDRLLLLAEKDNGSSISISQEETTTIVCLFLFHPAVPGVPGSS